MKRRTVQTFLVCPDCTNIAVIHRRCKRQKEVGHIKDLWCYRCMRITKHIEFKTEWRAEQAAAKMRRNETMPENQQIENNFRYHAPQGGQPEKYEAIRAKAKELAYLIDDLAPKSREQSLAMTNLEQAVFWANAAIARN